MFSLTSFNTGSSIVMSCSFDWKCAVEEVDWTFSRGLVDISGTRTSFVIVKPDLLVVVTVYD